MPPLSDHLARRRLFYPSPIPVAPSLLVIDVPAGSRGGSLCLGRYYPIIIETEAERDELEAFLDAPRAVLTAPDLLDHRRSSLRAENILISRYEPPEFGWPWMSVCRWPDRFVASARLEGMEMARGCYTLEAFEDEHALNDHQAELVGSLAQRHELSLRMISPDLIHAPGHA